MRKAGLDEAQAGIKIARRNINNLRYADDTTLMQNVKNNNRASKYGRQKLIELQEETDKSIMTARDRSIPLSAVGRSSRQRISKNTVELNSTVNHLI